MTSMMLWPIRREDLARTTTGSTYVLRVTMAGVTENLTFPSTGTLTADRNFWASGDAQADADGGVGGVGDTLAMLRATLLTHSEAVTVTMTVSAANVLTIDTGLVLTSILWSHASTTLSATAFGFAQSDTSTSGTLTGAYQTRGAWCPRVWASVDPRERVAYASGGVVAMSGRQRVARHATARATRDLEYQMLAQRYALAEYADATEPTGTIEHAFTYALSLGRAVRWYPLETSRTSSSYRLYVMRAEDMTGALEDVVDREAGGAGARLRWRVRLPLRRVSA